MNNINFSKKNYLLGRNPERHPIEQRDPPNNQEKLSQKTIETCKNKRVLEKKDYRNSNKMSDKKIKFIEFKIIPKRWVALTVMSPMPLGLIKGNSVFHSSRQKSSC